MRPAGLVDRDHLAVDYRILDIEHGCDLFGERIEATHDVAVARDEIGAAPLDMAEDPEAVVFHIEGPSGIVEGAFAPRRRDRLHARKHRVGYVQAARGLHAKPPNLREKSQLMTAATEDVELIRPALAYAIELYRELTSENGAPTLGTQNQIVDFILADPELRETIAGWARTVETDEATTRPRPRLPYDDAYRRIRDFAQSQMDQPVFMRPRQEPGDRR